MCGIAGFIIKSPLKKEEHYMSCLQQAIKNMHTRGPDANHCLFFPDETGLIRVGLGHTRLSILDTSSVANQPMSDESGRYTIIFNGEIFNFKELKQSFFQDKSDWRTGSDTEVLLNLWKRKGPDCIPHLNGFFAFAVYDAQQRKLWLVRDRMGIKPLIIYEDENYVFFSSEMKGIMAFPIKKVLNPTALSLFFMFSYLPQQVSMMENIEKLSPGSFRSYGLNNSTKDQRYYNIPDRDNATESYQTVNDYKKKLRNLLEESVSRRLISDVPLGCFLSGGIDSTIITGIAAQQTSNLKTFSIGFTEDSRYDETRFAELASRQFGTQHHSFRLTDEDLAENVFQVLDYIDEPFADSSSLAVFILSKKTRQEVTVALSGDGGDELFAGYHKHFAEHQYRKWQKWIPAIHAARHLTKHLPQRRASGLYNLFRQIHRFTDQAHPISSVRAWQLCQFTPWNKIVKLLNSSFVTPTIEKEIDCLRSEIMGNIDGSGSMNEILRAESKLVLSGDMLPKVDMMSMANSLEVRVPFLDFTVVDFAMQIPENMKIHKNEGKYILKETFSDFLPPTLRYRKKSGFEVPLNKLFRNELSKELDELVFNRERIIKQDIFNADWILSLREKINLNNNSENDLLVWSLLVFQFWYKKFFEQLD